MDQLGEIPTILLIDTDALQKFILWNLHMEEEASIKGVIAPKDMIIKEKTKK